MKKLISLMLCLVLWSFASQAAPIDQLWKQFPTLAEQLYPIVDPHPPHINRLQAINALKHYLRSENSEIRQGMKMILAPEFYQKQAEALQAKIEIDGKELEWKSISYSATDPSGDGKSPDLDWVEAKAFLDRKYNLSLMIRTQKKPSKQQIFSFVLDVVGNAEADFEIVVFESENGKLYTHYNNLLTGENRLPLTAEVGIEDIYEARFSLLKFLPDIKKLKETITLYPRTIDLKAEHVDQGQKIILRPERENYALTLLLSLLQEDLYLPDDSISIALALANNYLYSIADALTRKAILRDMAHHFQFYKELIRWQKDQEIKYPLYQTPLLPKLFWADRSSNYYPQIKESMNLRKEGKLSINVYREFVDRVETFRSLHEVVRRRHLANTSLISSAKNIENFVHERRTYRSSMENLIDFNKRGMFSDKDLQEAMQEKKKGGDEKEFFGQKRSWDQLQWLNFQNRRFLELGEFIGDCASTTNVQMGMYKASGIPTASFQWISSEGIAAYTHNFPSYYHPILKRWFSVQKPKLTNLEKKSVKEASMYFHYIKPIWHHWLYQEDFHVEKNLNQTQIIYSSYYPGELTDSIHIENLLTLGIKEEHFEKIFSSNQTHSPGLIFNKESAPLEILDSDYDKLPDQLEKQWGLDPFQPDSDLDNYADGWEIENGYDPVLPYSPVGSQIQAIDGIPPKELAWNGARLRKQQKNSQWIQSFDAQGDSKAVGDSRDIQSFSAKLDQDNLYLTATYHNDIRKNRVNVHSFWVTYQEDINQQYWIQWYQDHFNVSKRQSADSKKWDLIEVRDFEKASLYADEFRFPLSYFKGSKLLYIKYYTGGYENRQGKIGIRLDESPLLRVPLSNEDLMFRIPEVFADSFQATDKKRDYKTLKNHYDIKRFSLAFRDDKILLRGEYHHPFTNIPFGVHSFLFRDQRTSQNWWIQWWGVNGVVVRTWKDGEKAKILPIKKTQFDAMIHQSGYVFVLPQNLLENSYNLKVQYFTSAIQGSGSVDYRSDESEPILFRFDSK